MGRQGDDHTLVGAPCTGPAHVPRHLWRSPLLIFPLVHGPHGALDVLHTHETLVQAEVVPHGVLGVQGQGADAQTACWTLPLLK